MREYSLHLELMTLGENTFASDPVGGPIPSAKTSLTSQKPEALSALTQAGRMAVTPGPRMGTHPRLGDTGGGSTCTVARWW